MGRLNPAQNATHCNHGRLALARALQSLLSMPRRVRRASAIEPLIDPPWWESVWRWFARSDRADAERPLDHCGRWPVAKRVMDRGRAVLRRTP